MFADEILGNLATIPLTDVDWLDLPWQQCQSRALRATTRSGETIRILLPVGITLLHGDILRHNPAVVVNVLPCEVIVAKSTNAPTLARLAYEIGNLHLPLEIMEGELITLPDGPIESILEALGVPFKLEDRRFHPIASSSTGVVLASGFSVSVKQI